jgi:DDE domain
MARRERPFKGRQFTSEVILWAVRWYLQFPISYRDLELMLRDHSVSVDHTTIYRWIQAYAVELEQRLRPHLRPTTGSWRVDETYIKVKGRWVYLYRQPRPDDRFPAQRPARRRCRQTDVMGKRASAYHDCSCPASVGG